MALERPIIILGSVRSGTTLLGNILKRHPDIAYWEEPKHIWRHRHAYRRHDVLFAEDATEPIKRYIRREFEQYMRAQGKTRFMEKTPSNCLRVPFIREVFPDALFVHVLRDGRDAAISARVQWLNDFIVNNDRGDRTRKTNSSHTRVEEDRSIRQRIDEAAITINKFLVEKRRLSGGVWTLLEAPAYLPALMRVIARKVTTDKSFVWGTRFPGIQEAHQTYSLIEVCAMQWAYSVQSVLMHTSDLPAERYMELHYEAFTETPVQHLRQIVEFAGLPHVDELYQMAEARVAPKQQQWPLILSAEEQRLLNYWIGPLLEQLGYHTHEFTSTVY